ncbi:MAG: UvrD-helicase domain-containing protein [Bacteroidales bacterium]|nr:UvrD-helicase domain-containing protein [Bacteroidales bacterium]
MKASAGSGKTYNLAKTYLTLLFSSEERRQYKHILAVTFTNKATAEMKSRILKELHVLSVTPEKSGYFKDFVPSLFPSAESLRKKAEEVLVDILHDYSAFSVSTIDKFFQQTLKAFAREIGQFSAYQIELDKKSLIHESVDRILDSLTEDNVALLSWLNENVMNQLAKGTKVAIESELYDMAERLKSEEHRTLAEAKDIDDSVAFSKERLDIIRKECDEVIASFPAKVEEGAKAVLEALKRACISVEDTYKGFIGAVYNYTEIADGDEVKRPSDAFLRRAADPEQWFSKANAKKLLAQTQPCLEDPLGSFCALFDTEFKFYKTALLLREQTFTLGIAAVVNAEFEALLKEKNVLSLDDSNTLLHRIIDGSDAPFVYEKLGVRFENFLLDEFQDTSTIQWDNFKPLLAESDANGRSNLVVGDVKQSIYRWRGSDWKLLGETVSGSFQDSEEKTLDSNYRSAKAVVEFNNAFFKSAAETLGLSDIYADVAQAPMTDEKQPGSVLVDFCDAEEVLSKVCQSVKDATDRGARYGDIAVLVRNNAEGGTIATELIKAGIPVISDDSLDTKSSVTVRRLVSILTCVDNPSDGVGGFIASTLGVEMPKRYHSLVDLCEVILRRLKEYDPSAFEGEVLYIQSFMDALKDWTSTNGQNLGQFIKYWQDGSFHISSPADPDSVRIMTIHKSKGLEFPYVIFPFAENVGLYKHDTHWCEMDEAGNHLEASKSIFPVDLSSGAANTLFNGRYQEELFLQKVDNLNVFYVALTRAAKELHVICTEPSESFLKSMEKGSPAYKDLSHILYAYTRTAGTKFGQPYDYRKMERKNDSKESVFDASYPSFALNVPSEGLARLELSSDSADFFSEDGLAGVEASARLNGVVLHCILSKVDTLDDLRPAVEAAVLDGMLTAFEGEKALKLLTARVQSAMDRGWFDSSASFREVDIIDDTKGDLYRPDRVEVSGNEVTVIDYKFAKKVQEHIDQVSHYMDLYKRMGYSSVKGYLWYVYDDSVIEI